MRKISGGCHGKNQQASAHLVAGTPHGNVIAAARLAAPVHSRHLVMAGLRGTRGTVALWLAVQKDSLNGKKCRT